MSKFETWSLFVTIVGFLAIAGSIARLKQQVEKQIESQPRSMSKYERLSLLVSILGFVAVAFSIFLLYNQTKAQVESLRSSSYIAVNGKQLDLDNIFVQNAHLRPYFFEKKEIDKSDENYYKVLSVADYILDYFDLFFDQAEYFLTPETDPDSKALNVWETYITESFELSPILCQRLKDVNDWFTRDFVEFASRKCQQ